MFKKYIAMGLICIMGISCTIPSYANKRAEMSLSDIERYTHENVSTEKKEDILMEINTIDDYFFNEEYLTDISFDKEDCIYTYAIPLESGEKNVSHIKVDMYANGDVEFNITEGELHNELIYTTDNRAIIDGNEVALESRNIDNEEMMEIRNEGSTESRSINNADTMDIHNEMIAQPRALGSVIYDEDPFWGYARDYNYYRGKTKHNIVFDSAIQSLTISAIASLINFMAPGAGTVIGLSLLAKDLKSAYDVQNLKGKTLFYTVESWDNPKAPPIKETMTSYCKIRTKWFTDSNYSDEVREGRETYYNKTKIRDI